MKPENVLYKFTSKLNFIVINGQNMTRTNFLIK